MYLVVFIIVQNWVRIGEVVLFLQYVGLNGVFGRLDYLYGDW